MSYSEAITKNDLKKVLESIGAGSLNDYVIEQGTSGIWTYRKWKSGVAECWGIYSGSITSRTANAPYNSSVFDIGTVDYPTDFFADIPNVNVNTRIGSFYNLTSYANSYKDNVSISITSNATGTQTVYAYIYAKGKWKNDVDTYQGIGSIGAVLLDTFHPVGSYYETSDASFDPNMAWGGTWVKAITDLAEYRKVLWTSNAYADFAAQTISMDLSNYTFAEVEFYASSNTDIFVPNALKIRTGENGTVILMHNLKGNGTNENTGARRINVSTSGVAFTDYTYKNRRTGGTLTVANQFCVPRRIYGIKQITVYSWHRTA